MSTNDKINLSDKYVLSINEAALYFGIGEKKLRRILSEHFDDLALQNGVKLMVKRKAFEKFIDRTSSI
jgi:hypothetical protein